ncbi:hypothetical protein ACFV4P_34695 [Kitasatospora sp. NPDC059795]|uniref:hypothetical protein n=1 Tax=Kitasatospora sp. NPDC059795 TaxID=3346949 RepID=UPI003669978C
MLGGGISDELGEAFAAAPLVFFGLFVVPAFVVEIVVLDVEEPAGADAGEEVFEEVVGRARAVERGRAQLDVGEGLFQVVECSRRASGSGRRPLEMRRAWRARSLMASRGVAPSSVSPMTMVGVSWGTASMLRRR